jgi:hypothetical protein
MIYENLCLKIKLKIKIQKRQLPRDTLIGQLQKGPRQHNGGQPFAAPGKALAAADASCEDLALQQPIWRR